MVTFKRLLLWFTLVIGVLGFLALHQQISSVLRETQGGGDASSLSSLSGGPVTKASVQAPEGMTSVEVKPEPEPVDEEVVVSLADDQVEVSVIDENVHVAEEFVAEIDAESMEEADIESFIDDRRDRHALIRRRIEARRREQLADIRSETAKIYQSADESEDLLSLIGTENHGHTIHEVTGEIPAGSPVGAVFARIDDNRLLKVRLPLDQGFIASAEPLPELPPLPDLGDLPPPPLPEIGDLPLPPPASISKLDALRDEINE